MTVVVDTSALVALLLGEEPAPTVGRVLAAAEERIMAAPTLVELGIVLASRTGGELSAPDVAQVLGITSVAFDSSDAAVAIDGWNRFGKGNHPARLNLGDCFSYALAKRRAAPLVAVGDDFVRTDVEVLPER